MKPAHGSETKPAGGGLIVILAAISALGSLAIHMIVPALPLLSEELAIDARAAQQVVSFYLFGLAAGQFLVGPAIDRMGRRPVLLAGIAIYTLAAALGALAAGHGTLLAARVVQAIGASAGLVASRVIVGDLFDRAEAGRRQAMLMSVMLLSPALAPVLGGFVAEHFGWRPILGALALAGALAAAGSARFIPESRSRTGHRAEHRIGRKLLRDYAVLAANRRFIRTAAAIAGGSSALYMFLAVAPFLLIDRWGLDADEAGLCFLLTAMAGMGGTLAVGWIERRTNALVVGLTCSATGAALLFALALSGADSVPALIGPMLVMMAGAGVTAPAGIAVIVHAEEGLSGTATSLSGGFQMIAAGSAASVIGLLGAPSFLLLSAGMLCATLLALAVAPKRAAA